MPTISIQIASDWDDGDQVEDSLVTSWANSWVDVLHRDLPDTDMTQGFLRFTGITIPAGSAITDARLRMEVADNNLSVNSDVYGEDSIASVDGQANDQIVSRPKTAASVVWAATIDPFTYGESPDVSSVVRELVEKYGALTNASIAFIIDPKPSKLLFRTKSFSNIDGQGGAWLDITYDASNPPSMTTAKVNGDQLTIEYDQDVQTDDATGFTLGGTGASVASYVKGNVSNVLVFELSQPVLGSDVVTVDYAAGTVRNLADEPAHSQTGIAAANVTDDAKTIVVIEADGRSATVRSQADGKWDNATYDLAYMDRYSPIILTVDPGGANERTVDIIYSLSDGGQVIDTLHTDGDRVSNTFSLSGKILVGETVIVRGAVKGNNKGGGDGRGIHVDATNSPPMPEADDPVTNNSSASVGAPSIQITVKAPPGAMGPCVVSGHVALEDYNGGDLTKMQDAEIEWWLTGTGVATLPDKYKLVADPDTLRNAAPVDYTAGGNFRCIAGVEYILTEGDYTLNARLINMSGDAVTVTEDFTINADTRSVVTVNSAGGSDYDTLYEAVEASAGLANVRFEIADGHSESVPATIVRKGNNWHYIHAGTGTKPQFIEAGINVFSGGWDDGHTNTILEGLDLIPTTGVGDTTRVGYAGVSMNGAFNGIVSCDFNGEFVPDVGGARFDSAMFSANRNGPALMLNCTCGYTAGYSFVASSNSGAGMSYTHESVIGCTLGKSSNESCLRTVGTHRYFKIAYTFMQNDGSKSAFRLTGGLTVGGVFRCVNENGDVTISEIAGNSGVRIVRIDALHHRADGIWFSTGDRCHNLTVCNLITDNVRPGCGADTTFGEGGDGYVGNAFVDTVFEFCLIRHDSMFSGASGSDDGLISQLMYGCVNQNVNAGPYTYDIGWNRAKLFQSGDYNVYDLNNPPSSFVRRRDRSVDPTLTLYQSFAGWEAEPFNSFEIQQAVVLDGNFALSTPYAVPRRSALYDYWGTTRTATTEAGAAVQTGGTPTYNGVGAYQPQPATWAGTGTYSGPGPVDAPLFFDEPEAYPIPEADLMKDRTLIQGETVAWHGTFTIDGQGVDFLEGARTGILRITPQSTNEVELEFTTDGPNWVWVAEGSGYGYWTWTSEQAQAFPLGKCRADVIYIDTSTSPHTIIEAGRAVYRIREGFAGPLDEEA